MAVPLISIRVAESSDLVAIRDFGERVIVPYYESIDLAAFGRSIIDDYGDDETLLLSIAQQRTLVADRNGSIVGLAVFGRFENEPVIWKLYIEPDLRGQGLGRRLVEAVETRLPESDETILIEHAAENKRAASAYDGLAFDIVWTDPGDEPGETTVWRRRQIPAR